MAPINETWEVVGGAPKGGLVVRKSKDKHSTEVPGRLSTKAVVIALEFDASAERMLFEKVSGAGPQSGWVSTSFKGKQLMVRTDRRAAEMAKAAKVLADEEEVEEEPEVPAVDSEELALRLYCSRFGAAEAEEGELSGLRRPALPAEERPQETSQPQAQVCAELQRDLSAGAPAPASEELFLCLKPPGDVATCCHCRLPLGEMAYTREGGEEKMEDLMHTECMAQQMLKEFKAEENERNAKAAEEKRKRREEYDIGWKAEHIPRNADCAKQLSTSTVPQGLCCLVYDEGSRTVSPAATVEPQAAVNLNYLSTALEVRRRENREPLFSLDPVDGGEARHAMQVKRFEPAWLAGTDVGEVLFQSDYHLKELSMGEYEQPVLGMKSCHDFSDMDGPEWAAREWFVVRKAEVQMSGDNVLMPLVKMGVEAREQIMGPHGMEDVKTTKPNHPLVKYAESFTHNFELIAERKSVVFHLRELAKAAVMAKFLLESDVKLDDTWFQMMGETKEACCLDIPQLWNDRYHSEIRVRDGKLLNDGDMGTSLYSLYGGVQFGLDRFQLSGGRHSSRAMSAGLAARQFVQPARHLASTLSAGLASRQFQRSFGPVGIQPTRVGASIGLDKFSLSGARAPARMMSAGLAARQFVQPARHLGSTLSAGLATRQFQRSFGPMGVQPARVSAGVGLDKFALSGARQPARMMSAGLAARQFVQPARQLSATLSAGLATRQFQRSFGPMGVQPARVAAGVSLDKFALSGARAPARMMSAGLAARQFVQPARQLSATLSAGLATRQFQRSFGPMGVQPARVSAGVSLDKFALSGARAPARMMSAGLAARQFVQPARHLSATLSAGLATRQFQRSFGPMGVQPARVSAGVGLDKFALSGSRQPARMMSAGLAARQFVQPARHLSATLSAGLATRQFQRSFGPMGLQPARVAAGVSLDKFALSGARQPARMMSAGLAARQFVQPARHLSATLSAGLATRQFQRSFGPMGIQPTRVSASVGIDKFQLSSARQPSRMMAAGLTARQFVQPSRQLGATLSAGLATRQFQRSFGPMGIQPSRVSADLAKGVDLNLDEFNLSAPADLERQDVCVQLAAGADISNLFWSSLGNETPSVFSDEDKSLLKKVFNPNLSDRRQEGDRFVPPDTSFASVQKLRALVKEEELVQKDRRSHFFSKSFATNEPGPLFPASWKVTVEISHEDASKKQGRSLHARPDFKAQAHMFEEALKSAVPEFDKSTEDGTRFRVYRFGSLEVRTTQEHEGREVIGAVFSSRAAAEESKTRGSIKNKEKIVKATEYVESGRCGCHVYYVLETEDKNTILAEQLVTGRFKREENPKDLEDRNALAKVLRSGKCSNDNLRVMDIRQLSPFCKDFYAVVTGDKEKYGFRAK